MKMFFRLSAVLALFILTSSCAPGNRSVEITAAELEEHVRYLADDRLAGRMTGTPGITLAEEYIVDRFRAAGLPPPPGETDYYLDFNLFEYGFDKRACRLTLLKNGHILSCTIDKDFVPLAISPAGWALGEVVFAGYGITAPEYGRDDYAGLDVKGKIVLVFRHEPKQFASRIANPSQSYTRHSYYKVKTENADRHGAQAVLFVTDPFYKHPDEALPQSVSRLYPDPDTPSSTVFPRRPEFQEGPIPAFLLASFPGHWMLYSSGYSPAALQRKLDEGTRAADLPLKGIKAFLSTRRYQPPRPVSARNTAAFLPGRDPVLKDEWVIVGAHHDHLGSFRGKGDTIYNGADDNASGISGVLELAEFLAGRPERPKRSVLFMTFSAEESGLLGSSALFTHRLLPPDKFTYMCNLDMIGRNPSSILEVYVRNMETDPVPAAKEFLSERRPPTSLVDADKEKALSDDYEFTRRGIHSFFFFSGLHRDYHGVDDEADRLAYHVMEARVRLIGDFILFLGDR